MQRPSGRLIRRCAIFLLLASAAVLSSLAETQEKPKPTGSISIKEILDKNFAAMGLAKPASVQTLEVSGRFAPPPYRAFGYFRFFYKSPASYLAELDFIGHGQAAVGRNSDGHLILRRSANASIALNGVTIFTMVEAWQTLVQFQKINAYEEVDLVGLEEIDKGWAYAIRFVPKAGDPLLSHYDSDNFLLQRVQLVQRFRDEKDGPDRAYRIEVDYHDYRSTDNVTLPRWLAIAQGRDEVDFHVQSVRVNAPIDDAKFAEH